jgi:hypothetical protein
MLTHIGGYFRKFFAPSIITDAALRLAEFPQIYPQAFAYDD